MVLLIEFLIVEDYSPEQVVGYYKKHTISCFRIETIYFHIWKYKKRGANEKNNGLIRQYFPKKTDFSNMLDQEINIIERKLNNRPRKRFNFDTPLKIIDKLLFNSKVAFIT